MEPNIGIAADNRKALAEILSKILANEFVLFVKTKNAHWNIEGMDFYDKHLLFEQQAKELDELIDTIAERIRFIGHYAPASLQSFAANSTIAEESMPLLNSREVIQSLLQNHESIIQQLRQHIAPVNDTLGDVGTSDLLTGILQDHEKMAWVLRAHVNQSKIQ